ncbi:Zn-dependent hydrolase [Rhodococcoides trifolii]|uniref:Zn-dependent hydrolase n=1 Tax=Rhodococcoides trifolii TaxID=908250 RepID=A0A917FQ41_9NOCA|nr:M20 family metallo-hydrolase [Rhodococcus trifolii]GGF98917.1 Zn-dependent hydrolase [Rhodococcus trifolii]
MTTGTDQIRVPSDPTANDALIADFVTMSTFGATQAGGVERQAATAEDGANREWLSTWLTDRGFTVSYDRVGNQFGLFELVPGAPYVLAGSHLDSQPRGGKYDGAYGVLAAAHAMNRLRNYYEAHPKAAKFNLAVVNWFNEEGSRFKPSMQGSGVFTGKITLETALTTTDSAGTTVGQALGDLDMLGEHDVFTVGDHHTEGGLMVASYAEIHIEQGRELDKAGITMGLVDSTWGANKYEISVVGSQAHTGATAIADRQDALYGASLAVVALRDLADRYGDSLHTSCGQLTVYPNSPVVVAREVHMHLDLRSSSDELLDDADEALNRAFAEIELKADVEIQRRFAHRWKGHTYTPEGVELAGRVIDDLGISRQNVRTRAGHDSTNMKDVVPTVMLFVPSVDGVSHAENEYTHDQDLITGTDVLTETLARMAEGEL